MFGSTFPSVTIGVYPTLRKNQIAARPEAMAPFDLSQALKVAFIEIMPSAAHF